jgi:hypothetical protein
MAISFRMLGGARRGEMALVLNARVSGHLGLKIEGVCFDLSYGIKQLRWAHP